MIFEFFRFELRQQLRSPLLWLFAALFGLLAFGAASSDLIQIGSAIGNVNRNAPTVIVSFLGFFSLLGLLVIGIFIANALLRDFEQGTADLFFSSPMRKRDFLIGRFGAALAACIVVYLTAALGLLIAPGMPWIDPERLGHFSLVPYVWGFTVLVLPNLFFTGALLALLAVTTRSLLAVYVGVISFFVLWAVAGSITRDLDNVWIATLMEPFGIRAFSRMIRYWSADERNSGLPAMAGYLLANRALWSCVGLAMAASAFALFKPQTSGTGKAWFGNKSPMAVDPETPRATIHSAARVQPQFAGATALVQLFRQLRFDTVGVLKGVPFLIMLGLGALIFLGNATAAQSIFGTSIYPVTSVMLNTVEGSYSFFLLIIVAFYAGELVWKERQAKLGEVTDAMPVPNWLPLTAKMLALIAVVMMFQVIGGLSAVTFQLAHGFTFIEPLLYVKFLLLGSIYFVLLGGLSLVVQVFCNNKFIGFGVVIAFLLLQMAVGPLHFEHNLYNYGNTPSAPYSDMNGFGHFLIGKLWFSLYWTLCLLALLLLASALWVRGVAPSGQERWKLARQRLHGSLGAALTVSLLLFAGVGGWIFWNTNVLNHYVPGDVQLDLRQRYETEYRKYKDLPQPRIEAVDLQVDLRPETRSVRIVGDYRIRNSSKVAIPEVYLQLMPEAEYAKLDFGPATLVKNDEPLAFRIYRLKTPMQPGEERPMHFDLTVTDRGFPNGTAQTQIVANGTFFNDAEIMPSFGYVERAQINDRNERRKRHMGEPTRMPKLEDEAARANTYLERDADWIDYKATVCTAPDQIAISPGYLQKEFMRNDRRCFSYAMDRPMLDFYAFLSARWLVRRDSYQGIPIEVYYDPKHPYNVDRMIYAVKKSLAYYQANFTPYQHRQVRILEFPAYAGFAQSFANTIPYSESVGFIADLRDKDAIDYVFYITAHELAHQWWGHQVVGANVQGATMLSESLAQYSALMVMEKEYGRDKMRRFLKYELDNYLSGRGGELVEELPLFRVENQDYIHYRKGSLVFYRLREEMGEDALNRALKKFLQDKAYQHAPFTTSQELLGYIRAEAKPEQQQLITDLFEKISFYDNRVETATAKKRADGKYDVTLDLHADKRYADGKGKETVAPLNDWVEVGVFAQGASGKEADEKTLYLQRVHVTTNTLKLSLVVDGLPYEAGFDPYNKLIDRVSSDNRKKVDLL
jgi:ABC-type transport system involved in multi-copper enzyme maturation permease subunit